MKKILTIVTLFIMAMSAWASEKVEHLVERGETIESIAKKYNVSVQSILDANPNAKTLFYAGMILVIPENTVSQSNQIAQQPKQNYISDNENNDVEKSAVIANNERNNKTIVPNTYGVKPSDFNNVWIGYNATFDSFRYGMYGLGSFNYDDDGWGSTVSVHANFGLVSSDYTTCLVKFGPVYGSVLSPNVMVSALFRGVGGGYSKIKVDDKGKKSSATKFTGGITLTPCINFKFDKLILGLGYEFGWIYNNDGIYHCAQITLGLDI